jgi:hypothetical protein
MAKQNVLRNGRRDGYPAKRNVVGQGMARKRIPIPPLAEQSEFIDRLGGPTKVARMLTRRMKEPVSQQSVSLWRKRGIPHRYRVSMVTEAAENDIPVPANFLGEPPADPPSVVVDEVPFLK